MKKITMFIIGIMVSSISFTACSSCQVCTKASASEVRVCEKDYDSSTEFGLALDVYKALGYNCKASI